MVIFFFKKFSNCTNQTNFAYKSTYFMNIEYDTTKGTKEIQREKTTICSLCISFVVKVVV